MVSESDMRRAFIETKLRSDLEPNGWWLVEFPVGFCLEEKGLSKEKLKAVDAVCLTSRPIRWPDKWPESNDRTYSPFDARGLSESRRELFRRMRNRDFLGNEGVALVEFKGPEGAMFEGIGQLLVYRELFEADWNLRVDELILVLPDKDRVIEWGLEKSNADIKVRDGAQFL